ncbi:MAG: radical SAM protein, partial [Oscillospiraceae bacterium]|nr:radical SAM protein [Oscillospiraceae bacterium]
MILYLEGHDYRYAVEQCQLVFFPEDRPVFADAKPSPEAGAALSRLTYARRYACASTVIYHDKSVCRGHAYVDLARYAEGRARERALTWAVKLSFYRAAVRATGTRPPWGALTGIRPAGMLRTLMRDGMTLTQADGVLRSRFDVSPEKRALCRAAAASSLSAEGRLGRDDIGLYVGIPFCPSRCAYCTFVSHAVSKAGHLLPDFLEALAREIEMVGVLVKDLRLRPAALYIGGGTPTVLSAGQLETLAAKLSACFDLSSLREYTVEAGRPDTITREKLSALRRAGVTRISVNPQSLRDDVLRAAGRPHTANDALRAYEMSVDAGFSVNTDLIAGLPVAEHPVTEHTIAGRPIDGFDIDGRPSRAATEAFRESLDGILAL